MIFHLEDRIVITRRQHSLFGRCGRVVQLRRGDGGAFVEMEERIPEAARIFAAKTPRANWIIVHRGEARLMAAGAPGWNQFTLDAGSAAGGSR